MPPKGKGKGGPSGETLITVSEDPNAEVDLSPLLAALQSAEVAQLAAVASTVQVVPAHRTLSAAFVTSGCAEALREQLATVDRDTDPERCGHLLTAAAGVLTWLGPAAAAAASPAAYSAARCAIDAAAEALAAAPDPAAAAAEVAADPAKGKGKGKDEPPPVSEYGVPAAVLDAALRVQAGACLHSASATAAAAERSTEAYVTLLHHPTEATLLRVMAAIAPLLRSAVLRASLVQDGIAAALWDVVTRAQEHTVRITALRLLQQFAARPSAASRDLLAQESVPMLVYMLAQPTPPPRQEDGTYSNPVIPDEPLPPLDEAAAGVQAAVAALLAVLVRNDDAAADAALACGLGASLVALLPSPADTPAIADLLAAEPDIEVEQLPTFTLVLPQPEANEDEEGNDELLTTPTMRTTLLGGPSMAPSTAASLMTNDSMKPKSSVGAEHATTAARSALQSAGDKTQVPRTNWREVIRRPEAPAGSAATLTAVTSALAALLAYQPATVAHWEAQGLLEPPKANSWLEALAYLCFPTPPAEPEPEPEPEPKGKKPPPKGKGKVEPEPEPAPTLSLPYPTPVRRESLRALTSLLREETALKQAMRSKWFFFALRTVLSGTRDAEEVALVATMLGRMAQIQVRYDEQRAVYEQIVRDANAWQDEILTNNPELALCTALSNAAQGGGGDGGDDAATTAPPQSNADSVSRMSIGSKTRRRTTRRTRSPGPFAPRCPYNVPDLEEPVPRPQAVLELLTKVAVFAHEADWMTAAARFDVAAALMTLPASFYTPEARPPLESPPATPPPEPLAVNSYLWSSLGKSAMLVDGLDLHPEKLAQLAELAKQRAADASASDVVAATA